MDSRDIVRSIQKGQNRIISNLANDLHTMRLGQFLDPRYRKMRLLEACFVLSKSSAATAEDTNVSKLHSDITEQSAWQASRFPEICKDPGMGLRVQDKDSMCCTVTKTADAPHESTCGRRRRRYNEGSDSRFSSSSHTDRLTRCDMTSSTCMWLATNRGDIGLQMVSCQFTPWISPAGNKCGMELCTSAPLL